MGAFILIVIAMSSFTHSNIQWLGIALMFAILIKYKPLKQCLELQLNQHVVAFTLHLDILGRVWATSCHDQAAEKSKIGKFYGFPVWLSHTIKIGSEEYKLLIWVKPYPQGFLVGHGSEPYQFKVNRNAMCL